MRLPDVLEPLRGRSFRLYWGSKAVSLIGDCMQYMAFGWLITELSDRAADLALRNFLVALPVLLLSLKAGEMADRIEKRRILMATSAALMVITLVISLLVYSGRILLWHVLAFAPLVGIAVAFEGPAAHAFTAEIVEPPQVGRAVALMHQVLHGARLVGPAAGGVLIERLGNGSPFVVNGITYLVAVIALGFIGTRGPAAVVRRKPVGGGTAMEALRFVNHDRPLRALAILLVLANALVLPFLTVFVVYYVRIVLGADDPAVVGGFIAAGAGGAVVGAIAMLWGSSASRRWWLLASVVGSAALLGALALRPSVSLAAIAFGLLSLFLATLGGRLEQVVLDRVPDEFRGRVMALVSIIMMAVMPPCALAISWIADVVGFARVTLFSGIAFGVLGSAAILHAWVGLGATRVSEVPASGG